jgi:hypothetical protein
MALTNSTTEADLRSIRQRELDVLNELDEIESRGSGLGREIVKILTRTLETLYDIDDIIQRQNPQEDQK